MNNKKQEPNKPIHWNLKNVPDDAYEMVKEVQHKKEITLKKKVSIEKVVYAMIRHSYQVSKAKGQKIIPDTDSENHQ